ncbi:holliday junction resolvase [Microbacterium phage SBlackberry]|nr:holliday junction resolvase [Microbacterium phage Cicada]UAW08785.1 holliday junction resolvase [Microbacterium phage SBlackberry]
MVMRKGKPAIAQDFGVRPRNWGDKPAFLAIDPGDVHVGLAEFTRIEGVWYCTWAGEKTPDEFLEWYVQGLRMSRWVYVVIESWKLFPQAAPIYVGSDMPTSRLIGAIRSLARFIPIDSGWFDEPMPTHLQDPQIKIPTRGVLKRRKLRSVAKILGVPLDHASDAELHGYKFLIDQKEPINNVNQQNEYWAETRDLSGRHSIW